MLTSEEVWKAMLTENDCTQRFFSSEDGTPCCKDQPAGEEEGEATYWECTFDACPILIDAEHEKAAPI